MPRKATAAGREENPEPAFRFTGELKYGMRGDSVKALQAALKRKGFPCAATGSFGTGTVLALRRFQHTRQLPENGIFGKTDYEALMKG
jgi:peptidoglycan hydrolase-like protein with peptidoglycan-binding domain